MAATKPPHLPTVDDIPFNHQLVVIDSTSSILDAFTVLTNHKLLSAPVRDAATHQFIGFFDVSDFTRYVVEVIDKSASASGSEEVLPIEFCDLYDLLMAISELHPKTLESVLHTFNGEKFPTINSGAPLKDVLTYLANEGMHRVAVVDPKTGAVTKIVSQSAVISFLVHQCGPLLENLRHDTVGSSGIGIKPVTSVPQDTPAIDAFKLLLAKNLSGLAVLDEDGTLETTISHSDLRTVVAGERFRFSGITALEFVQQSRQKVHDLSELRNERPAAVTVTAETSLLDVFHKLDHTKLHRLFVVDAHHKVIGVVSLKDLLRYVLLKTTD